MPPKSIGLVSFIQFPKENFIPKFHYARHVVDAIDAHGCVLDCFATERKHYHVKQIAEAMDNTKCFERTVMARVSLAHLERLSSSWMRDGLKHGVVTPELGVGWSASQVMQLGFFDIGAGDVFISNDSQLVMVHACLERRGTFFVLAKLGRRLEKIASTTWEWLVETSFSVFEVDANWSMPALWYARSERPDCWVVIEM